MLQHQIWKQRFRHLKHCWKSKDQAGVMQELNVPSGERGEEKNDSADISLEVAPMCTGKSLDTICDTLSCISADIISFCHKSISLSLSLSHTHARTRTHTHKKIYWQICFPVQEYLNGDFNLLMTCVCTCTHSSKTTLKIIFIYLGNNNISCIFKTCRTISLIFHRMLFVSYFFYRFPKSCAKYSSGRTKV
jgi:hypothetical protein